MSRSTRTLLLSDDRDIGRVVVIDPDRLILLTTWDYLHQFEERQRIQSADAVIEAVRSAGRNPPTRDLLNRLDPEIREAGRAVIDGARRRRQPRDDK